MDPHQIEEEREHMFQKSLTPSDVGKLNRLVIPKQHAEKYFPLAGEKSFLLNFEDESGKGWPFRYSFWTSSQSYVLTKGWNRYIKEKRLDVRDVVVFQRCHRDHHLYIGFRRRGDSLTTLVPSDVTAVPWSQLCNTTSLSPSDSQLTHQWNKIAIFTKVAVIGPLNPNRVRLFGVNLD